MFLPDLARILAYILSIGFLLYGPVANPASPARDAGRETLPANDGWASAPTEALPEGTTGGSAASATRTVASRKELLAALAWPDPTPKLILVKGTIDMNVDDAGKPLDCAAYAQPDPATGEPYSLEGFLAVYDPQGPWAKRLGRIAPFGGLENARRASAAVQADRIRIRVPPNTTIFGLGNDATLVGAWLDIWGGVDEGNAPMNVIVRNINFVDTHDCFPEWSPDDGPNGNWNAAYDSISIRSATHVWIDHNRFANEGTRDDTQPIRFGHRYQVHDGLVDITNASDFVTISWNVFASHDKVMLIGNSDSATQDRERLRVTLHHNLFDGTAQRTPRVRFGRVHVYNNVYRADRDSRFRAAWGAGLESAIVAENNYFHMSASFNPLEVIDGKQGSRITVKGNCWREREACEPTDFLALWNARFDPDLRPDAGWTPSLYGAAESAEAADQIYQKVLNGAGPGRIER